MPENPTIRRVQLKVEDAMTIILNFSVIRYLPWTTMPDASRRDAISITPGVSRGRGDPSNP
jgi:hypothetical protein